jgi:hypothetical protein
MMRSTGFEGGAALASSIEEDSDPSAITAISISGRSPSGEKIKPTVASSPLVNEIFLV